MSNDKKIDFAAGQITALTAIVRCLIKTHPDVVALHAIYQESFQAALAAAFPVNVSEDYLAGLHETDNSIWLGLRPGS